MGYKKKASDEYKKNFRLLIEYVCSLAMPPNSYKIVRSRVKDDIASVIGAGRITDTMIARYLDKPILSEHEPSTHLALAQYLRGKTRDKRWGDDDQAALTAVYDWLLYGPEGAPEGAPANRHAGRPSAERIEADTSPQVRSLGQLVTQMNRFEILNAIELLTDSLRYQLEYATETPESEPEPEPICEDDKPLPTLLLTGIQESRPVDAAKVEKLANVTRLSVERCREILCGQLPTEDELPNLSAAIIGMSPTDLANYIAVTSGVPLSASNDN